MHMLIAPESDVFEGQIRVSCLFPGLIGHDIFMVDID